MELGTQSVSFVSTRSGSEDTLRETGISIKDAGFFVLRWRYTIRDGIPRIVRKWIG